MHESAGRRSFRLQLAVIVGIGAALRIARFVITKWNQRLLLNDSLYYSAQAQQLAHGVWFREVFVDLPGAEHGPLTSALMSLVSWGDAPFNRQRMVTVACGIATVAVIGLIGRRLGGDRVGLIAAAIAAVSPNLFASDGLVMSESVSILVLSLTLLAVLSWTEEPRLRRALVSGGLIGLAALARSELLLLAPMTAIVMTLIGRRRVIPVARHVAGALAVTAAVLAPWTIFNAVRFDDTVIMTTNEGPLLLGSNCDETYYGPGIGGWSLTCIADAHFGENGEDPSVRSSAQRRQGLAYARHHVSRLPLVAVARAGRALDLFRVSDLVGADAGEERERAISWAGVFSFWILAPLAVVGASRVRRAQRAVLLMPVVIVAITSVVFYGSHRMRSSAEPVIVLFAAVATDWWSRRDQSNGSCVSESQLSESPSSWATETGTCAPSP